MDNYEYKLIKLQELKPYDKNSRTHSSYQITQIKESIKQYGFTNPLLVDENMRLIAGHGRLEAIKALNKIDYKDNPITELPCIIIKGLSENDYKALVIADNKIALNAGWDLDILKTELLSLESENYNLDLIGFSNEELSELLSESLVYENELNNLENKKELNDLENKKDTTYTDKIVTPIYEIKGLKPNINQLYDTKKTIELIAYINKQDIDNELKAFLITCCYRFADFNFANIAEYYAHADKETQELFEKLLLVFVDYDRLIEKGYIELINTIESELDNEG